MYYVVSKIHSLTERWRNIYKNIIKTNHVCCLKYTYIYIYTYINIRIYGVGDCSRGLELNLGFQGHWRIFFSLGQWAGIESYQGFQTLYLIPPCLTLIIIRWVSRVQSSNPGKGVAPSPTLRWSTYWKGRLRVALDYCRQHYLYTRLWHAHTRGLPWGLPEVVGTVQVHCSRRRLLRRGLEFHVCTINKSAHTKKIWKLI